MEEGEALPRPVGAPEWPLRHAVRGGEFCVRFDAEELLAILRVSGISSNAMIASLKTSIIVGSVSIAAKDLY
jgi:hypothetical protein